MSRGYAQDISPSYGEYAPYTYPVVSLVASQKFPEEKIRQTLTEGLAALPGETLFVLRASPRGAEKVIAEMLKGRRVVFAPSPYYWDVMFDLVNCCSRCVVFHTDGSSVTDFYVRAAKTNDKIRIVEG